MSNKLNKDTLCLLLKVHGVSKVFLFYFVIYVLYAVLEMLVLIIFLLLKNCLKYLASGPHSLLDQKMQLYGISCVSHYHAFVLLEVLGRAIKP